MRAKTFVSNSIAAVFLTLLGTTPGEAAKKEPVLVESINCVSAPLVLENRLWIAVDWTTAEGQETVSVLKLNPSVATRGGAGVSILFGGRIVDFPKLVLEPASASSGGVIVAGGSTPPPVTSPCSYPELTVVDGTLVLDWVVSESDGVISFSRYRNEVFETPAVLACNAGEALPDCRIRLRAELVLQP